MIFNRNKIIQFIKYKLGTTISILTGIRTRSRKCENKYREKYIGQRCFIIGNGPSLTKEDLEKLSNEVTFASNRIYKMFESTDWRPTFYAIMDESVARSEGVIEGINSFSCDMKFAREQGYLDYKNIKDICLIHSWYSRKYLEDPHFSSDITKGIYTIATVTYAMIEIAVFMGFNEIYLLGVDNNYSRTRLKSGEIIEDKNIQSYFGQPVKGEEKAIGAAWEMDIAFEFAEKYSREHGFRIYNATRGGKLEAFERVDLDSIL